MPWQRALPSMPARCWLAGLPRMRCADQMRWADLLPPDMHKPAASLPLQASCPTTPRLLWTHPAAPASHLRCSRTRRQRRHARLRSRSVGWVYVLERIGAWLCVRLPLQAKADVRGCVLEVFAGQHGGVVSVAAVGGAASRRGLRTANVVISLLLLAPLCIGMPRSRRSASRSRERTRRSGATWRTDAAAQ